MDGENGCVGNGGCGESVTGNSAEIDMRKTLSWREVLRVSVGNCLPEPDENVHRHDAKMCTPKRTPCASSPMSKVDYAHKMNVGQTTTATPSPPLPKQKRTPEFRAKAQLEKTKRRDARKYTS